MTLRELLEQHRTPGVEHDSDDLDGMFEHLDLPLVAGMHGSFMEVKRTELSHNGKEILLDMSDTRH